MSEWSKYIAEVVDEVPISKGFTYKEGTKATGVVIEDNSHNEFVWIPVDNPDDYKKTTSYTEDLPSSITNEAADVKLYHGFYIGRYEATIPDNATSPTNSTEIPTCQSKKTVLTNISYNKAKPNAESMYKWENGSSVQSGLLTGKAWDTTCN